MRRPNATLAAVVSAVLLASACDGCSSPASGPPPERFVPASASGVVVVPRLAEAARQAAALHATLSSQPGQFELQALRGALSAQLSFDPFDPASMTGAGLDVGRGAAMAQLPPPPGEQFERMLLVLPVGDQAKLEALVARVARDRLGAAERGKENANGRAIDVWRRALGEPALVAMVTVERTALVSIGRGGPEALRSALAQDPAVSLAQSPSWQRARAALGDGLAVAMYTAPGGTPLSAVAPGEWQAAGLSLTARSGRLVVATPLGASESRYRPLAGPGPGRSDASPLDPATLLAVRISAAPAAALALAEAELPGGPLAEPLRKAVAGLEGPIDLGLSLSPSADLSAALGGAPDPLRVVRVEAVAATRAGAALAPLLDQLVASTGDRGAVSGAGPARRWRLGQGDTAAACTLAGGKLLLVAGPAAGVDAALDALVARGAGGAGWRPPSPAAAEALAGGLGGAVLDGAALGKALQALPTEAFGSGPDGVMTRSLVEKAALPGGQAVVASLRADLPSGALRLVLEVALAGPGQAP